MMAVAPYGKGRVAFVGDVNASTATIEAVYQLGLMGEILSKS